MDGVIIVTETTCGYVIEIKFISKSFYEEINNCTYELCTFLLIQSPCGKLNRLTQQEILRPTNSSSSFTGFYNPVAGFSLLILEVSRSHTMTQHSR